MQIFWRYISTQFLKTFFLSLFAFVLLMMVLRMKETAEFASMGASIYQIPLFLLYQLPFILPIAIPTSCLLASFVLMQKLSQTHELVALRSCGLSLRKIVSPLLNCGLLLTLLNGFIVSEITPSALLSSKQMIHDLASTNPLLLLQNSQFLRFKQLSVSMTSENDSQSAKNLQIFIKDPNKDRISFFQSKKIEIDQDSVICTQPTFITYSPTELKDRADHLIIDSQTKSITSVKEFIHLLKDSHLRIPYDHLTTSLLEIQKEKINQTLEIENRNGADTDVIEELLSLKKKCAFEEMRRFSLALSPLCFSLLGASFGINFSRRPSQSKLGIVILLSALAIAGFFLAKSTVNNPILSASMLYLPEMLIFFASVWALQRCSKGIQ